MIVLKIILPPGIPGSFIQQRNSKQLLKYKRKIRSTLLEEPVEKPLFETPEGEIFDLQAAGSPNTAYAEYTGSSTLRRNWVSYRWA